MSITISTHVLDTAAGRPAVGVEVELFHEGQELATVETDADGRARFPGDYGPGLYAIAFNPPSPFFQRVELTVELDDGHYHVPLLISPYGCASYRGS
jgi:5-hydroxyisourate hydrolase